MAGNRRDSAREIRIAAAELAANRSHPSHVSNGDETKFRSADGSTPSYLASFTKGMPHNPENGLLANLDAFQTFVNGIDSGDPRDFIDTPLGPGGNDFDPDWLSEKAKTYDDGNAAKVRAWESQGAGNTFDLEGPDAQAVTMPPAPVVGGDELIAEIAEVYAQAILRDVPFTEIAACDGKVFFKSGSKTANTSVQEIISLLNNLAWFQDDVSCDLNEYERGRKRGPFNGQTVFRGVTPGDNIGPYISQFMLAGNEGVNSVDKVNNPADGYISYGSIRVDQRVRFARPCEDHMVEWGEYIDVQNGADLRGGENYESDPCPYRFITTPRDLATYVHYDALYEAYLNACLLLLGSGAKFDPGIPFQKDDHVDHQQGFAHFGGPHILSLVTEVATRALKAVRFQKFNVHRRLRPEALAARLSKHHDCTVGTPEIERMVNDAGLKPILELIDKKNPRDKKCLPKGNYLLPLAFCEGSPMHPSYGAGHATVAGACVTILKAFFDHSQPLALAGDEKTAFVPNHDGSCLERVPVEGGSLTVEGELNKLASNISIGRDWAGVHYFSDYIESIRMGEQIALGILEEQKLTYGENFSMTVPLFDGGAVRI